MRLGILSFIIFLGTGLQFQSALGQEEGAEWRMGLELAFHYGNLAKSAPKNFHPEIRARLTPDDGVSFEGVRDSMMVLLRKRGIIPAPFYAMELSARAVWDKNGTRAFAVMVLDRKKVIEIRMPPIGAIEARKVLEPYFAVARELGLDSERGAGHLNVDLKVFKSDPVRFVNMLIFFHQVPVAGKLFNPLSNVNRVIGRETFPFEVNEQDIFIDQIKSFQSVPRPGWGTVVAHFDPLFGSKASSIKIQDDRVEFRMPRNQRSWQEVAFQIEFFKRIWERLPSDRYLPVTRWSLADYNRQLGAEVTKSYAYLMKFLGLDPRDPIPARFLAELQLIRGEVTEYSSTHLLYLQSYEQLLSKYTSRGWDSDEGMRIFAGMRGSDMSADSRLADYLLRVIRAEKDYTFGDLKMLIRSLLGKTDLDVERFLPVLQLINEEHGVNWQEYEIDQRGFDPAFDPEQLMDYQVLRPPVLSGPDLPQGYLKYIGEAECAEFLRPIKAKSRKLPFKLLPE